MKQNIKSQPEKTAKTGEKKKQEKADSSKRVMKNEEISVGEDPVEPVNPTKPKREYEDPGHEHVYQPPTANTSPSEAKLGYVGE